MTKPDPEREMELRRLRDRMAALAAGPRLHHALVYIPDPDETGARDLFPPIGGMPVGPRNAPDSRVTPTWSCWRIDTERTDSEDGFARCRAMKPATLELIWADKADEQHAENAAGAWLKIAADLWARLSPDDWGPFRVSPEIGPSLGASKTACDWGRLPHLAAWSGRVPGLRTRIRRFNTLWPDRGWSRFADEETGTPADDFTVTPILPGVPVEFEASTYYASILHYDAVGDSLALIDHLLNPSDGAEYKPASYFGKAMGSRLRKAADPQRKEKRVRSTKVDGVTLYNVADARRWWPSDMPDEK